MVMDKRRWFYPVVCFFITFLGGSLYAYSVIGFELQRLWGVSASEAGAPYYAALASYGYLMFLEVFWREGLNPRKYLYT